jgi:hypothetical protein
MKKLTQLHTMLLLKLKGMNTLSKFLLWEAILIHGMLEVKLELMMMVVDLLLALKL